MKSYSSSILSVPPAFSASLDAASRAELQAVLGDPDRELAGRDLLNLGRRWLAKGDDARAVPLFSLISESEAPAEIKRQAGAELDAILGRGHSGRRLEYLSARFSRDLTDYRQLLPMLAAGWVGEIAGAAALARLGGVTRSALTTRWLVGGTSLLAETSIFVGAHRALTTTPEAPLGKEIGSTALGFGVMRLFGGISRNAMAYSPPQLHFARPALFQASLFAGLYTARLAEEAVGLRQRQANATLFADTLAGWLGLRVGAGLGQGLLGSRWKSWQTETAAPRPLPMEWIPRGAMACFAMDWQPSGLSFSARVGILLGVSGLTAAGLGLYRFIRWAHVPAPKPGEFFYTTSPSERWALQEFFPFGKVPERISWTAWKKIQGKVLHAAGILPVGAAKRFPRNWKQLELRNLAISIYSTKEFHYLMSNAPMGQTKADQPQIVPDPFPSANAKPE